MVRKGGINPLLLAGIAAAGYYAYSKMSPEKKQSLMEKGKKLAEYLPAGSWKDMLGKVAGM